MEEQIKKEKNRHTQKKLTQKKKRKKEKKKKEKKSCDYILLVSSLSELLLDELELPD
jgi:hypothetical protein